MKRHICLLLLVATCLSAADPSFIRHDAGSLGSASDLCVVDVNNDNHKDIVATGYSEGICWFKNDGNQNYYKISIADTTNHKDARSVRATLHDGTKVDFNNDGFTDLVSASMKTNRVSVWINSTTGQFTETVIDSLSPGAHTVDLADLDKDGDIDVLIAAMGNSTGVGQLAVYYNNGNMLFNKMLLESSQSYQSFIYTADMDNDGTNEIVFSEYGTGKFGWFKKVGSVYEKNTIATVNGMHTTLAKDYDKDGDSDILTANYGSSSFSRFSVWNNNGSGILTQVWNYTGMGSIWLDMADFDNDGDNDLVGAAQNPGVSQDLFWFKNNGSNSFTANPLIASLSEVYCAKPADLDNDGDQDIVIAANKTNINPGDKIIWWENSLITGIEDNAKELDQGVFDSYPNPFNPQTNIRFQLNRQDNISLNVFNSAGSLVKKIFRGELAPGLHSFDFSGSDLNSGIYICRLEGDNSSRIVKVALIK